MLNGTVHRADKIAMMLSIFFLSAAAAAAAATASAAAAKAAAGPDLDCKIHVLAVEFAKQLQPERDLGAVAIGLQVTGAPENLTCTFGPVPPPAPPAPPPPPPPPPPKWPPKGTCSAPVAGFSLAQESGAAPVGAPCKNSAGKCMPTAAACEAKCTGNCTGYTWHDKTTGSYFQACYLATETDPWHGGAPIDKGHLSGICNNAASLPRRASLLRCLRRASAQQS